MHSLTCLSEKPVASNQFKWYSRTLITVGWSMAITVLTSGRIPSWRTAPASSVMPSDSTGSPLRGGGLILPKHNWHQEFTSLAGGCLKNVKIIITFSKTAIQLSHILGYFQVYGYTSKGIQLLWSSVVFPVQQKEVDSYIRSWPKLR